MSVSSRISRIFAGLVVVLAVSLVSAQASAQSFACLFQSTRDYSTYYHCYRDFFADIANASSYQERLPSVYKNTLGEYYSRTTLERVVIAHSDAVRSYNQAGMTDCTTIYFANSQMARDIVNGRLTSDSDFHLLFHELEHTAQCVRWGGRESYAERWFTDLWKSLSSNWPWDWLSKTHDAMPMEKEADRKADLVLQSTRSRRRSDGTMGDVRRDIGVARFFATGIIDRQFHQGSPFTPIVGVDNDRSVGTGSTITDSQGRVIVSGYRERADGKIIGLVARLTPDGILDATFGVNGLVEISDFGVTRIALDGDGLLVAGWIATGIPASAVTRLKRDGTVDPTFYNGNHYRVLSNSDRAVAVQAQPDGHIVVVSNESYRGRMTLERIPRAGGVIRDPWTLGRDVSLPGEAKSIALARNGDIFVAGNLDKRNVFVRKFSASGQLDPSFGDYGTRLVSFLGSSWYTSTSTSWLDGMNQTCGILISGSKLVVAGTVAPRWSSGNFALARLKLDGSFDTGFGVDGVVQTDFSMSSEENCHSMTRDSQERIILAGQGRLQGKPVIAIARYSYDGVLDDKFGSEIYGPPDGKDYFSFPEYVETWRPMVAVDQRDRIILTADIFRLGSFSEIAPSQAPVPPFAATTFAANTDWMESGDFNGDGRTDVVSHTTDGTIYVHLSDGSSFQREVWLYGWGTADWAGVGDFNGDGKDDLAWYEMWNNHGVTVVHSTGFSFAAGSQWLRGWGIPDWAGVGDFNGDGKDDLAWYEVWNNHGVTVVHSTGFSFGAGSQWLRGWGMPDWAGVGDFNGDGRDDLAWYEMWNNYGLTVVHSTGVSFGAGSQWLRWWDMPDWARIGDLNSDGKDDLVWYEEWNDKTAWLLMSGNNGFLSATPFVTQVNVPSWAMVGNVRGGGGLIWAEGLQIRVHD